MNELRWNMTAPVRGLYDVLVAGGGVAGLAASIAAARRGSRVMLLERQINLGGLAATGLINLFEPMCDGSGHTVVGGLCRELLDAALRYGYDTLPPAWREGGPVGPDAPRFTTRFSPQMASLAWAELAQKAGVELLLGVEILGAEMDGQLCRGLVVQGREGPFCVEGRMVVDATGDAAVLASAGVPTAQGQNYFTYVAHEITLDSCVQAAQSGDIGRAVRQIRGGSATLSGLRQPPDMPLYSGLTSGEVTEYILKNQTVLLDKLRDEDRTAREVVTLPSMPQFRGTRHICGRHLFREEDAGLEQADSIGVVTDFSRRGRLFEVSAGCLYHRDFPNLLAAGRCAGAEGFGWDILRVIPSAIVTGQAAGALACAALEAHCPIRDAVPAAQRLLGDLGVPLHISQLPSPGKERLVPGENFEEG